MTNNEKHLIQWIEPVIEVKSISLAARPLMHKVDTLGGPARMLKMMMAEQIELNQELIKLRQVPQEEWNGNRIKAAEEAADVLVFAAAGMVTHGLHALSESQLVKYVLHLQRVYQVQEQIGVNIPEVAVGVIRYKNDRFNYREFPFQEIPGETDDLATRRFTEEVWGLKTLRKQHPQGVLTDEILEAAGYREDIYGSNPVLAYQFLKGIASGTVIRA